VSVTQVVEDDAGFDGSGAPLQVDLQDLVHVSREVQHHRRVARLPGETGSACAAKDRQPTLAADLQGGLDVGRVAGGDHSGR